MRGSLLFSSILAFCASGSCDPAYKLLPRQDDLGDLDFDRPTCSERYGEGNVLCNRVGCYNPDVYEQCCVDGLICIAEDNSCCDYYGGPGVSGTADGTPVEAFSYTPTATTTAPALDFTCPMGVTRQDCCSRGGPNIKFCSETITKTICYDTNVQQCCENGIPCFGESCCELIDSKPKGGKPNSITDAPTSSAGPTKGGTETTGAGTGSTGTAAPKSSNVAATRDILGGAAAAGVVGLVAWL